MLIDEIILMVTGIIFIYIYWNYTKDENKDNTLHIDKRENIIELIIVVVVHVIAILINSKFQWMLGRITDNEIVRYMIITPIRASLELVVPIFYLSFIEKNKFREIGFKKISFNSATVILLIFAFVVGLINYLSQITSPVHTNSVILILIFTYQFVLIEEFIFRGFVTRLLSKILNRSKTLIISTFLNVIIAVGSLLLLDYIPVEFEKIIVTFIFIFITRFVLNLSYLKTKNIYVTIIANVLMNTFPMVIYLVI